MNPNRLNRAGQAVAVCYVKFALDTVYEKLYYSDKYCIDIH